MGYWYKNEAGKITLKNSEAKRWSTVRQAELAFKGINGNANKS